jgi:4'-phosphopantetheinyl transferase
MTITPERISVPRPPGDEEVHIWSATLDRSESEVAQLTTLLSDDERTKAARFSRAENRTHYIVTRGLLRQLLAAYVGVDAAKLQFSYGPQGKPALIEGQGWQCNVAHSHGRALLAVTRAGPVGVDLERLRVMPEADAIAARYFSEAEHEIYRRLSVSERSSAFLLAWTRKEAVLKADGTGVSFGLHRIEVTLVPGEPARLLRIDGDAARAAAWTLQDVDMPGDFLAAIAVAKPRCRVCLGEWR